VLCCCDWSALILSALKANHIQYSPFSVRRALQNSTLTLPNVEVFAQGSGLLQVSRVFCIVLLYVSFSALHHRVTGGHQACKKLGTAITKGFHWGLGQYR